MRRLLLLSILFATYSFPALAQPTSGLECTTDDCPLNRLVENLSAVENAARRGVCESEPDAALERKFRSGNLTPNEFVEFIAPYAQASEQETGIPASITIAQAALETGWGRSARRAQNNLFGIKGSGNAGSARLWTREYVRGRWVRVRASFAAYTSFRESVIAHGRLISERPTYARAMEVVNDPRAFARALQRAGYATDPGYASKLLSIVDARDLTRYDDSRDCSS